MAGIIDWDKRKGRIRLAEYFKDIDDDDVLNMNEAAKKIFAEHAVPALPDPIVSKINNIVNNYQ